MSGIKNAYTMLGSTIGLLVVCLMHRRVGGFSEKAVWWAQILKVAVGFGLVIAVRTGVKAPLLALCGGHTVAHAIRYFALVLVAGALWPMTFRFYERFRR